MGEGGADGEAVVSDLIPNPRDNKRKRQALQTAQERNLHAIQVFVFALALLLLAMVS